MSGPIQRVRAAPTSLDRSGPSARARAKTPRTSPTITTSARRDRRVRERLWGECTLKKALERHHDLAEDLAALQPLQALLEILQGKDRVDDRGQTARHLGKRLGDVAHAAAEGAED